MTRLSGGDSDIQVEQFEVDRSRPQTLQCMRNMHNSWREGMSRTSNMTRNLAYVVESHTRMRPSVYQSRKNFPLALSDRGNLQPLQV